jgi:hypothetical protein
VDVVRRHTGALDQRPAEAAQVRVLGSRFDSDEAARLGRMLVAAAGLAKAANE